MPLLINGFPWFGYFTPFNDGLGAPALGFFRPEEEVPAGHTHTQVTGSNCTPMNIRVIIYIHLYIYNYNTSIIFIQVYMV